MCGYEGDGTLWLNAGTLPAHSGCCTSSTPPPTRRSSPSTRRTGSPRRAPRPDCARTRSRGARRHAAPLQRRHVRRRHRDERGQLGRARDLQRGRHAASRSPRRVPTTSSSPSGWVTLADPTPPGLSANGPTGVQSGARGADPVAGIRQREWLAGRRPTQSTAARAWRLRGQACSWLCGTRRRRERRDRPRARSPTGRIR